MYPSSALIFYCLTAALLAITGRAAPGSESDLLDRFSLENSIDGATAFSLLYGLPLLSWMNAFRGSVFLKAIGTNKFFNTGQIATPASRTVVSPNADTIYALAVLDLAHQDVVVTLPQMQENRLYLLAFFDPYGSQYAGLGSVDQNEPGEYLLRQSVGTGRAGLDSSPECDPYKQYQGCIDSPTYDGTLLVRVLAKNNGSDLEHVNSYIRNITLEPVNKRGNLIPQLSAADFDNLPNDMPSQVLELTARLGDRNPPQDLAYYDAVPKLLQRAGIKDGKYTPQTGANLTEAYRMLNDTLFLFNTYPDTYVPESNGWRLINPSFIGQYDNGTDLAARSAVAIAAYLANTPQYAIYPMPNEASFSLGSDESYLFTFPGKPPVERDGFWSITAYGSDRFLIPNPVDVYQVGDRSNITYPDGSLVYPTADHSSDGAHDKPFQVLIQPSNVAPPANWTHNWLPSPNDTSSSFNLIFRLFAPKENAENGQWQYPLISKQAAIRG